MRQTITEEYLKSLGFNEAEFDYQRVFNEVIILNLIAHDAELSAWSVCIIQKDPFDGTEDWVFPFNVKFTDEIEALLRLMEANY